MEYQEFLKSKQAYIKPCGFCVERNALNKNLSEWQKDVVTVGLKKGKYALFEDTGLGKTRQQLEFAKQVHIKTGGNVLILAPLAVSSQTQKEGQKIGIDVTICRGQQDVKNGINITNYEMLEHFDTSSFIGVVLDESSILKNSSGKTRTQIIEAFKDTQYKLACTATPAPNDFMELGNHSEFLGVMRQPEMLATFFVHDGGDTAKWRLKGHAEVKFWEWISSWACVMTNPRDLGYDGSDYDLPELKINEIIVESDKLQNQDGQSLLFAETSQTLQERRQARRESLSERVQKAAEIANTESGQVLVWCDLNSESEALIREINGAYEVKGPDTPEHKTNGMMGFSDGSIRVLVSKPSICGFGMNWQNCSKMIFVGLSDSFEAFYQAVRRCWRFGQTKEVEVYIVISDAEGAVKANIERKQADAEKMKSELVKYTKDVMTAEIHKTVRISDTYYAFENMKLPEWLRSEIA